ncbi:MAG: VIT domain-containing protein [Verrucomicrobium sp.]
MKPSCLFKHIWGAAAILTLGLTSIAPAAGILTPKGAVQEPLRIVDHHVNVTLNNGFARTEVTQTFYNPNPQDLEAVYRFPLPKSSSLSEVTLTLGEKEIHGEVVEKTRAKTIYETEKQSGNDAGLATKETFQAYEFRVTPVRAQQQTRLRLVYYQPLEIDTGVCRYLYPLEDGGTEDAAASSFWAPTNSAVDGTFSADVEVKSAWPVTNVRLPGFEGDSKTDQLGEGHYKVHVERKNQPLTKDLVVYYRLEDNLPGRVEVIPYRAKESGPGTFMMVVTPGLDLQPLNHGADYVFVLDTSGSMNTKLQTLTKGIGQVIGKMSPQDRFRVISFSDRASDVTGGMERSQYRERREHTPADSNAAIRRQHEPL